MPGPLTLGEERRKGGLGAVFRRGGQHDLNEEVPLGVGAPKAMKDRQEGPNPTPAGAIGAAVEGEAGLPEGNGKVTVGRSVRIPLRTTLSEPRKHRFRLVKALRGRQSQHPMGIAEGQHVLAKARAQAIGYGGESGLHGEAPQGEALEQGYIVAKIEVFLAVPYLVARGEVREDRLGPFRF